MEEKCRGAATVVRSKLAAIWSDPPHLAHHAIASREAALHVLKAFDGKREVSHAYVIRRPVKVFESLQTGKPLGKWLQWKRKAETFYDGKRALNADGSTRPWKDVAEYRRSRRGVLPT
jgi:hypothetical protein